MLLAQNVQCSMVCQPRLRAEHANNAVPLAASPARRAYRTVHLCAPQGRQPSSVHRSTIIQSLVLAYRAHNLVTLSWVYQQESDRISLINAETMRKPNDCPIYYYLWYK